MYSTAISIMTFDFTGKSVLVTGAGRGLGRALALEMAKAGAKVYALSRTQSTLDSLAKENSAIETVQVDLLDWESTRKAVDGVGYVDLLVNNAITALPSRDSLEVSREELQKVLDVNLLAAINVSQVVGKKMKERGQGGAIVNVSSINGLNPMKHLLPYNICKAALDMITRQMALELGPYNIRVNSVNPTVILTERANAFFPKLGGGDFLRQQTPLGKFCDVEEVVRPILFLLSDHASMITGTRSVIDGGLMSSITV